MKLGGCAIVQGERRILVIGASGMLGHALLRYFAGSPGYVVSGSVRSKKTLEMFSAELRDRIVCDVDANDEGALQRLFTLVNPHVVVNAAGVVKQLSASADPVVTIAVNALFPHKLNRLCRQIGARLIHISTDCVFRGSSGMYGEDDTTDAMDLYGRSKALGEVGANGNITLRTSIIGPELGTKHGLLEWFLGRKGTVRGYRRAIFSGLSTVELARVIRDVVLPREELEGIYHVSSKPISKYDLLRLLAERYERDVQIVPDDEVVVDRSLNSRRFRTATGYEAPEWAEMVRIMWKFG